MGLDFAEMGSSLVNVLGLGLAFGAGLPLIFALGIRALSLNAVIADGGHHVPSSEGKALAAVCFTIVGLFALAGLLLITEKSIIHYLGVDPIPFDDVKK